MEVIRIWAKTAGFKLRRRVPRRCAEISRHRRDATGADWADARHYRLVLPAAGQAAESATATGKSQQPRQDITPDALRLSAHDVLPPVG